MMTMENLLVKEFAFIAIDDSISQIKTDSSQNQNNKIIPVAPL